MEDAHIIANTPAGSNLRIYFHDRRSKMTTSAMIRISMFVPL
jgi:hypothetical protein